jgi:clan AA aspartic protease (TIGR02281 family)
MNRLFVVLALLALGACQSPPPTTIVTMRPAAARAPAAPTVEEYIGPYHNGLRSGEGIYTWADGRRYVGTFRQGLPNGHGVYTLPNGETYDGDFRDNRRTQGIYTWPDGRRYVGAFRDDKPSGAGTYTWPDGKKYVGDFREGRAEGNGTYTWPDGRKYVGEVRGDVPEGHGTLTLADGRQQTGAFRNGDYVGDNAVVQAASTTASGVADGGASGSEVALERRGGTFLVPVRMNDSVSLDFYLDSGAADVNVPLATFNALRRAGTVRAEDIIGSENYLMANGVNNKATIFTIRTLTVGSVVLQNVRGSVSELGGPPLLGMSFLSRFSSWTVDNGRSVLILR